MADFRQLLGTGYQRLGELLQYAGVDTSYGSVPNLPQFAGYDIAEQQFRAAWLTTVLLTGTALSAPVVAFVQRLRHMMTTQKDEVYDLLSKNESLQSQVALVTKYFTVNEEMVNELQQMVTLALVLLDDLSDKAEAATQSAKIFQEKNIALQDQLQRDKETYDQAYNIVFGQLKHKEEECKEHAESLARMEEREVNHQTVCELLEDSLHKQEDLHVVHMKKQQSEHTNVLDKVVDEISGFFDGQDKVLHQMEAYHRATLEQMEERILDERIEHEASLEYFDEALEKKDRECDMLLSKLEMERGYHTHVYSELKVKHEAMTKDRILLTGKHNILLIKYNEVTTTCEKVVKERDEAIESRDYWKKKYENLERKVADGVLNRKVDMLERRMTGIRAKNIKYKAKEAGAKSEHWKLEHKIAGLEERYSKQKKRADELTGKLMIHERDDKSWTDEIKELKKQIKDLKGKYDKSQDEIKKTRGKVKEVEEDLRKQRLKNMQVNELGERLTKRLADKELAHKKEIKQWQNQLALAAKQEIKPKPLTQVVPSHQPKLVEAANSQLKASAAAFKPASAPVINSAHPTSPGVVKVKSGQNIASFRNGVPAGAVGLQKVVLSNGNMVPSQQPQVMVPKQSISHPPNEQKKTFKAAQVVRMGHKQNGYQQQVQSQTKNGQMIKIAQKGHHQK